jgi:hypothetical protein
MYVPRSDHGQIDEIILWMLLKKNKVISNDAKDIEKEATASAAPR